MYHHSIYLSNLRGRKRENLKKRILEIHSNCYWRCKSCYRTSYWFKSNI